MAHFLKRLLDAKTAGGLASKPQTGEVVPHDAELAGEAIVDTSWVEDQIAKMIKLCDAVEKKHNLPPQNLDGRELYNYVFPNQLSDKCPVCAHAFGKFLQKATYCPKCKAYLRVRYGHLVSDEDEEKIQKIRFLNNMLWRYREIEPDQLRMYIAHGCDEIARQVLEEFSHNISEYL